jgi:perosamine synthetase
MNFIPVNEPLLNGNEKKYLMECIDSGWISSEGPFVAEFEERFAAMHKRKHAIAVSNGTAALQISLNLLDLKAGDEVIVPTFTIISCVSAILYSGAKPVLVDCDPNTFNASPQTILNAITDKTKAILLVHTYGLPVDMKEVIEVCNSKNVYLIEDCAEVIGLKYYDQLCGGFGDISVFSFYSNKHITTGEGGMILTDQDWIKERSMSYRNLCFQKEKRFVHERIGWNYRMTNLQAAVGLAQLERLDEFTAIKRSIGTRYHNALKDCRGLQLPIPETNFAKNIYWVFSLVIKQESGLNVNKLNELLHAKNIGTRPFFYPMHKQPIFQSMGLFENESYPNSEKISSKGIYIPSGMALKDHDLEYVIQTIFDIMNYEVKLD